MSTHPAPQAHSPVVIVGAGPTGLTAATLLAQYGVETLLLERWPGVHARPRAVHLDDEVYRILARLGIGEQFAAVSRPGQGLRLLDPRLRVLAEFRRSAEPGVHGYPAANMYDQPDLEALLRGNLARYPSATLHSGVEVTAIDQDGGPVTVSYTDRASGTRSTVTASYVLGCDGANSVTRTAIGTRTKDLGFAQRWLVVDLATEADLGHWEGVHQVCDPHRAATFMRVGATRYRWEFRLLPHESSDDFQQPRQLRPLIAPWTADLTPDQFQVLRVAEYTFRAQIARTWRDRRVFLLGDAAHLTPPFIGQGLGAGVRDAANLAWKLAGVLNGSWPEHVLDSYQAERKPHATAMIRLAKLIGTVMTRGGRTGNALRAALLPRLSRLPAVRRQVLTSRTPALHRSALVVRPRLRRTPAGTLCPNARINDTQRFDDLAAGRLTLVTVDEPTTRQVEMITRHGGRILIVLPGSELFRWLHAARMLAALVRPDGTVLSAGHGVGSPEDRLHRPTAAAMTGRPSPPHRPGPDA
ncbi:bifunctional 3-(3-hydroxy-phenyl)propionate/3-hydroxycinnamic acid hydroxylase [Streptacidiphilus sp. N1-12]|uniref:Bifunctional 3-(3-hydroxy-phenyl)propionate/3-hydroxycinnamic acid hydroxylase n=2 Tax=Streptacidiphilus alkalitolerans TaxID=3342712 RepID=A0ABV6WRS5_9ACTN